MKNIKILLIIFSLFPLLCCSFKQDFDVTVKVENLSKVQYDSIRIYVYPDRDTVLYNFKPNQKFETVFKYRDFEYRRGEDLSGALFVFKDDFYRSSEAGLIDVPYLKLKDSYQYFIYDNYIAHKKGVNPDWNAKKYNIKEYIPIKR